MRVIILGLRRSGTTAFWQTWRQDERFVCYNEPLAHLVSRVGDPNWRALDYTGAELRALWERDPAAFWDAFAFVYRQDELRRGFSDAQRRYLRWLFESAEHVCVDLTRAHFKVADLKEIAPDAVLVHLRRPPANWVTSIALPSTTKLGRLQDLRLRSWRTLTRSLRNVRSERRFWTATSGFPYKGYEEIMAGGPDSAFGHRLREAGLDPEAVYPLPLVARLLSVWQSFGDEVEATGPQHFGDRFLSIDFNAFCAAPGPAVAAVYERLGEPVPALDFSRIHAPPPPFDPESPLWARHFGALHIDQTWLP